jgi:uncharacterized membrane protein YkvA (DUF1232 family)
VLGYLDDMIIVPLGIAGVLGLVPADVLDECREQAQTRIKRPVSWFGAAFVLAVQYAWPCSGGTQARG